MTVAPRPWALHAVSREGIEQTGVRQAHIRRRASRRPRTAGDDRDRQAARQGSTGNGNAGITGPGRRKTPRSCGLTLVPVPAFQGQPSWGPLRKACGRFVFACAMTPAEPETLRAPVERGIVPAKIGSRTMTLATANAYAASLASTLMVAIIIFRAGDGTMSVMPATEYDGDDDTIVSEIDPFA